MQDTQSVWEFLSGIPIGTIVAWVIVICAIISALCAGTIKLYKIFTKYKEAKDKDEKQQNLDKGEISINKLRSLEEMYDEYVEIFHGNGYVKTLVTRVRKLKIIGKLDD